MPNIPEPLPAGKNVDAPDLLRAALAHGERAKARPITIFPQARTEHTANGRTFDVTCRALVEHLERRANVVRTKGEGDFWTPGRSANGRKRDEDCTGVGWLAVDHDAGIAWDRALAALDKAGAAFVAYESPSATETVHKWRLALPLRHEWHPSGDVEQDRHRWKKQLYRTAREALEAATGAAFDPSTDALLNRFYPCTKRTAEQKARRVIWREGIAFDIEALWHAAADAGLVDNRPAPVYAEPTEGERPLIAAFKAAGWVLRQRGDKVIVRCPWEHEHDSGRAGDTSTVIFATSGVFHCSHAHCADRTLADVVDELPDSARDLYDELTAPAAPTAPPVVKAEVLDIAIAKQNKAISEWIHAAAKQKAGRLMVTAAQGSGKTTAALRELAKLRDAAVVLFYCQTVEKADEAKREYEAEHASADSLPFTVIRGRSQADPRQPDAKMCPWHEVANAAAVAGVDVLDQICRWCPHTNQEKCCGYIAQMRDVMSKGGRGVFAMAQDYAFLPSVVRQPATFVIFDEDVTRKAGAGFAAFSPDRITSQGVDATTQRTLEAVRNAITKHRGRELATLRKMLTLADMKAAKKALRLLETQTRRTLQGAKTAHEIRAAIQTLETSEAHKVYVLIRQIVREWPHNLPALRSVVFELDAKVKVDGKVEQQERVTVRYLKRMQRLGRKPVLVLDGTGSLELNRRIFGADMREHHVDVARNAHVTQVRGRTFAKSQLIGCGTAESTASAAKLRSDVIAAILRWRRKPETVVFTYKELALVPDADRKPHHDLALILRAAGVQVAWLGALRGLNKWKGHDIVVLGRLEPNQADITDMARAWRAEDSEPLPTEPGRYKRELRSRRMRDGSTQHEPVSVAADPLAQALLEQVREADIAQAIDRGRFVFNREPGRVLLLTSIVVPGLVVDEAPTWKALRTGGTRMERALQRFPNVLPLVAPWLVANAGDVFGTKRTAEREARAIDRHFVIGSIYYDLAIYRYGRQKCPSRALVRAALPAAQVAAELTQLVGAPLTMFKMPRPAPAQVDEVMESAAALRRPSFVGRVANDGRRWIHIARVSGDRVQYADPEGRIPDLVPVELATG